MTDHILMGGKKIRVGTFVKAYNKEAKQQYAKYQLCVCLAEGYMLFVNTDDRDRYQPTLEIRQPVYTFLKYNSYICCNRVTNLSNIDSDSLQIVGILKKNEAKQLLELIKLEGALPKRIQDKIVDSLKQYILSFENLSS